MCISTFGVWFSSSVANKTFLWSNWSNPETVRRGGTKFSDLTACGICPGQPYTLVIKIKAFRKSPDTWHFSSFFLYIYEFKKKLLIINNITPMAIFASQGYFGHYRYPYIFMGSGVEWTKNPWLENMTDGMGNYNCLSLWENYFGYVLVVYSEMKF